MGKHYHHITIEERCEMACLQREGLTLSQIAASLDRSPSTVSRELSRNSSQTKGYEPSYADQQARARRWQGSKLDRDPLLRRWVLGGLSAGWSPQQVAGRLELGAGRSLVSHETIYRFVHAQGRRTKDHAWFRLLPQGKTKRGRRGRKGHPYSYIHLRQPISQRTPDAQDRRQPGHWEADLMLFGNRGQSLLVLQERHSRLILAQPMFQKSAQPMAEAMVALLSTMPPPWRRTVTFDNGSEFAQHHQLHSLGIETFFCNTHSPWQKGGVENANGRLRRYLPRKTDLRQVSSEDILQVIQTCNNTPRKCLGYRTPAETFYKHLLHLKCERTFPPSRERRNGAPESFDFNLTAPLNLRDLKWGQECPRSGV